jgi:membrane protein DedA with SNARE-associated domain
MTFVRHLAILTLLLLIAMPLFAQENAPQSTPQTAPVNAPAFQSATPSAGLAEQVNGTADTGAGFVARILKWYDANMNYYAVGILMTIESSFIPFPSEVVIPPAVFVAANPASTGGMKIWLIVLVGTLGAMLGAYINYYLSRWLGRPIIYAFVDSKVGHMLMLSGEKMEKAEKYFNDHGNVSTLIGRLVPVVRQLISIPAGLAKMPLGSFSFFTFLGAFLWNSILAVIGYYAYKIGQLSIIKEYSHTLGVIFLVLVCIAIAFFVARGIIRKKKGKTDCQPSN